MSTAQSQHCLGVSSISEVHHVICDVNELFLTWLRHAADLEPAEQEIAGQLAYTSNASVQLLALECPFPLIDVQLANGDFWRDAVDRLAGGTAVRPLEPSAGVATSRIDVAHAALIAAWYVINRCRAHARLLLGTSQQVAEIIGQLRPSQVHQLATSCANEIRPHWLNRPHIWRQLLLLANDATRSPTSFRGRALLLFLSHSPHECSRNWLSISR